jgi:hypothetical protein
VLSPGWVLLECCALGHPLFVLVEAPGFCYGGGWGGREPAATIPLVVLFVADALQRRRIEPVGRQRIDVGREPSVSRPNEGHGLSQHRLIFSWRQHTRAAQELKLAQKLMPESRT